MYAQSSHSDPTGQLAYLHDMLESGRLVLAYTEGVPFELFLKDSLRCDAVSMRLAVIGEAANHITVETARTLPSIPFRAVRGMRNRLAHDYGHIDFRIVWEVATKDIAPMVAALDAYLGK